MQTVRLAAKPTKQRKRLFQAPDHVRYKLFAAPLSPELRTSHGVKALPVRNGDTVHVMRGDHRGFEGKITRVDRKKYRIYVEGLTREKVDGTTIFVPVHPSKVMITRLNIDDKWRKKVLERKKEARKKIEEVAEKLREEVVEEKEKVIEKEVAREEKPAEEKPKRRRKKVTRKPAMEKVKEEEKPRAKTKKTRAKRKITKKTEGGT